MLLLPAWLCMSIRLPMFSSFHSYGVNNNKHAIKHCVSAWHQVCTTVRSAYIVTDRVAWSVGLSVALSPSEPYKNGWSDGDAVCVDDSGGLRETPFAYSGPLLANTVCVHSTQYSLL